jgi:hypothetical protein
MSIGASAGRLRILLKPRGYAARCAESLWLSGHVALLSEALPLSSRGVASRCSEKVRAGKAKPGEALPHIKRRSRVSSYSIFARSPESKLS